MESDAGLPPIWTTATIGDLLGPEGLFVDGDWIESKDQDPSGGVRLIQLADIGVGEFSDKSNRFLTEEKAQELSCTFLRKNDVLIARMPDPLGRACLFPLDGDRQFVTAVDVCIVRPGNQAVDAKFIMHALNSPRIRVEVDRYRSGSTRKRISRKNLARIALPIAPAGEQRRIVEKIEELFSELDNGVANLQRARQQLQVYRQALLKQAFAGHLTAWWREENPHDDRSPANPEHLTSGRVAELPRIPPAWSYQRLGSLIERPRYGTSKKCSYEFDGRGVLRIPNIANGLIDAEDLKGAAFDPDELSKYELKRGDLLMIRSNGSVSLVGRSALITEREEQYLFAGYLIRLRSKRHVLVPEYLNLVLSSYLLRRQIEAAAKSTSGVHNINAKEIQSLRVPVCSLREQELIVAGLNERLSRLDALAFDLDTELKRADVLRQSVLRRAFSGQLVPQDPADEPASAILERIASEDKPSSNSNRKRKTGT